MVEAGLYESADESARREEVLGELDKVDYSLATPFLACFCMIDHENPWQFNVSVFCMRLFGNFLQIGTMFPWIGAYNIVHAYSYISEGDGHSTKLKEGHSFRKHYMCHFRR